MLQEFWWGWVFLVSVPVMALAALASMIMAGAFYVLPQYFQNVQQSDPLGSGLRMLPLIAGTTVGSVVVSLVPRRLSAGIAGGLGFLLLPRTRLGAGPRRKRRSVSPPCGRRSSEPGSRSSWRSASGPPRPTRRPLTARRKRP